MNGMPFEVGCYGPGQREQLALGELKLQLTLPPLAEYRIREVPALLPDTATLAPTGSLPLPVH